MPLPLPWPGKTDIWYIAVVIKSLPYGLSIWAHVLYSGTTDNERAVMAAKISVETDGDLFITATQQDNGNDYFFAARVMPADDEGTVLVTRATLVNGLLAPSLGAWHCANTHDAITSVLQWMNV